MKCFQVSTVTVSSTVTMSGSTTSSTNPTGPSKPSPGKFIVRYLTDRPSVRARNSNELYRLSARSQQPSYLRKNLSPQLPASRLTMNSPATSRCRLWTPDRGQQWHREPWKQPNFRSFPFFYAGQCPAWVVICLFPIRRVLAYQMQCF